MTNAVLKVSFSDEQTVDNVSNGLKTLVYSASGGETSFQDDLLVGATILDLSRDGLIYTPVTDFSGTAKKEFKFYPADSTEAAGTIVFHPSLPAMEPGEDVVITYIPQGQQPVGATEPITRAEAKAWAKIEVDDDDAIVDALITAARQACESYVSESWVQRTVTAILKNELGNIRLPYGPVVSITDIKDSEDNLIESDNYSVVGDRLRYGAGFTGWFYSLGTNTFSISSPWYADGILRVQYLAGYTVLPQQRKTALLMQFTWMYYHRGDEDNSSLAPDAKMILKPYRAVV